MMARQLLCTVVLVLLLGALGVAQETKVPISTDASKSGASNATGEEIPLARVWALDMPNTKRLRFGIDAKSRGSVAPEGEVLREVLGNLQKLNERSRAPRGYVVEGEGIAALKQLNERVKPRKRKKEDLTNRVSAGVAVSAVFVSKEFGRYVHVTKVLREKKTFRVEYAFVPHLDTGVSANLALIPLGELAPGQYEVEIVQGSEDVSNQLLAAPPVSAEVAKKVVCRSFRFTVEKE